MTEPNSVYICGPMTGIPLFNKPAFDRAERLMQETSGGTLRVYNPSTVTVEDPTWANYMRADIPLLLKCEAVYVLKGWENSKGAKLEIQIAQALGMTVIYEA